MRERTRPAEGSFHTPSGKNEPSGCVTFIALGGREMERLIVAAGGGLLEIGRGTATGGAFLSNAGGPAGGGALLEVREGGGSERGRTTAKPGTSCARIWSSHARAAEANTGSGV